ncbi:MAG: hypothetical protein ABH859_08710 [Pseudomonadota bacterium]
MTNFKMLGLFGAAILIVAISLLVPGSYGCGGMSSTSGSGESGAVQVGGIAGTLALENSTGSASFESNLGADLAISKSLKVAGLAKIVDPAVSGVADLYDLEDQLVASVSIVSGEYSFSSIPVGTYKLILTLATPVEFVGLQLSSYVEVTEGDVVTARADPLSTITVAAAEYNGNIYGITGNALAGFDLDMMIGKIRDCYETLVDLGIEDTIEASTLQSWESDPLDLATLAAKFDELPGVCKTLGYTSFARGRLLAAGNNPAAVTQAMCDILHQMGFIISLNQPNQSFCHYSYYGSPFTSGQVEVSYCPVDDDTGCAEEGTAIPLAVIPDAVEDDRNDPDNENEYFLPIIDEYTIMSMAKAYIDGISLTAQDIYTTLVDNSVLGLRQCFESGISIQYCLAPDDSPLINMVYDEDLESRLAAAEVKVPSCHEILPILCDEGESISSFSAKDIDLDAIEESIIFKRIHLPWNRTGGEFISVVYDSDPYAGNPSAAAIKVNIVRDENLNIVSVVQDLAGAYYLSFNDQTNEDGSTIPVSVTTGLPMVDINGRDQIVNISDVGLLPGVDVHEVGVHLYTGPSITIAGFDYAVVYDGWQIGAAPIEVCVSYSDHYTVIENEDGTCDGSQYYLGLHDTSEIDNTAELLDGTTAICALVDPSQQHSETNTCVRWLLTSIFGLEDLQYRDVHNYVYSGDVTNPRYLVSADPYFDDFPPDLCNVDADLNGVQDDGDGIWCSETMFNELLCDVMEPSFSWRPYMANPNAPYSVSEDFYRWAAEKSYVKPAELGGAVQTIACGDVFSMNKLPPEPDEEGNILPDLSSGDFFDFYNVPADNGLAERQFKARFNTYSIGRPITMINMASLALGGKAQVTPATEFNVIEAFAFVYLAWNTEGNIIVPQITLPAYTYDAQTGQAVDVELINERFYSTFMLLENMTTGYHEPFTEILTSFGVPETYLDDDTIWNLF